MRVKVIGLALAVTILGGCGNTAFRPPIWKASSNTASRSDVGSFLRGHVRTYDRMISELEVGKSILEVPIIPAAVIGVAGVAVGAGTNLPIVLGSGAAGLSAGSAYLRPRDRLVLVVQARAAAVCIHTQFSDQVRTAVAGGYLKEISAPIDQPVDSRLSGKGGKEAQEDQSRLSDIERQEYVSALARGDALTALGVTGTTSSLGLVSGQVIDLGGIAVGAAEEVVTRLKLRLANIGAAPEYGAIVTDLRQRFEDATVRANDTVLKLNKSGTTEQATIKRLSEYSARVAECLAKLP